MLGATRVRDEHAHVECAADPAYFDTHSTDRRNEACVLAANWLASILFVTPLQDQPDGPVRQTVAVLQV